MDATVSRAAYAEGVARIRLGLCQLNTVVGDLDGNVERILAAYDEAEAAGCDVAVFPELAITGYPPEDLVLKPGFVAANRAALDKVAARTGRCAAVVGFVDADRDLYNAAAVCAGGEVRRALPQAPAAQLRRVRRAALLRAGHRARSRCSRSPGVKVGIAICEDVWSAEGTDRRPVGRRRRARADPERLAVLPGAGRASASAWWPPGPRTPTATSST